MKSVGVDILTIGQYLQPTNKHEKVDRWVEPSEFNYWKQYSLDIGFGVCESGALIRSSYHAEEQSKKFDVLNRRKVLLSKMD